MCGVGFCGRADCWQVCRVELLDGLQTSGCSSRLVVSAMAAAQHSNGYHFGSKIEESTKNQKVVKKTLRLSKKGHFRCQKDSNHRQPNIPKISHKIPCSSAWLEELIGRCPPFLVRTTCCCRFCPQCYLKPFGSCCRSIRLPPDCCLEAVAHCSSGLKLRPCRCSFIVISASTLLAQCVDANSERP